MTGLQWVIDKIAIFGTVSNFLILDDANDANEEALSPAQSNEKMVSPFSSALSKINNEGVEGREEKVSPPSDTDKVITILPNIGEKVSPLLNEPEKCLNDKNVICQAPIKAGDKDPESKENCAPGVQLIQRKRAGSSKSGSVLKIR
jgi:hypothetical protein